MIHKPTPAHGATVVNVDINQTMENPCPNCGNLFFRSVVLMRRVPAIYSPSRRPEIVPLQAFECTKCRSVMDMSGQVPEKRSKGLKIVRTIADIARIVLPFLRKK